LFYPHGSGGELATYLYARLLSEAGINVIVITNRFAGEPDVSKNGKLTVYRLPLLKRGGSIKYSILQRFDILFSSFIRKMFRWADVVYVPRFWYSAIPLAKAHGKPVLTHLHDYIPICPLSNIYDISKDTVCNHNSMLCPPTCIYIYEKTQGRGFTQTLTSIALNSTVGRYFGKLVKFSDAIICVSEAQRGIIIKEEPSLQEKTYVIYNPLPKPSYIKMEGEDFGYFGGSNPLKGFHILCQALTKINTKRPIIHATGFFNPAKYARRLSNKLRISFYERLDCKQFEKLYERICAVIVPSIWPEPLPYAVGEALLKGRVLIASRIGGIPEQAEGCKGAFLFEAGNYYELAEKLEYASGLSKETLKDLGTSNRETFMKRFNNEKSISNFINVCEKLI